MLTLVLVTGSISGITPMPTMVPDNQSMTPMTTDFTNNTEESGLQLFQLQRVPGLVILRDINKFTKFCLLPQHARHL
jgi:hypothetical protein